MLVFQGKVIGHADPGNAGRQQRLVRDAVYRLAADEDARIIGAKRLAVLGGGHEHDDSLPLP